VLDSYVGRTRNELPPHIFAVAQDAHAALLRERANVSIVVSGESGAGKTEACRQLLAFLTRVSTKAAASASASAGAAAGTGGAGGAAQRVRDRLITANTVLEALGNAATVRNDNSSRYGKLMRVFFSAGGVVRGGAVSIFLLERRRIAGVGAGAGAGASAGAGAGEAPSAERCFHALHQLAAGASPELRRELHVGTTFRFLGGAAARTIPGVSDARNFAGLGACLKVLGFDAAAQKQVFRVLSLVLNLGELDFEEVPGAHADAAAVDAGGSSGAALAAICDLLGGAPAAEVEAALVKRSLKVKSETTLVTLSPSQAAASRDALARTLYERLFAAVVARINVSINAEAAAGAQTAAVGASASASASPQPASASPLALASPQAASEPESFAGRTLGLLDIFGFESLQSHGNSNGMGE
jgi:myosin heavy subunit